MPPPTTPSPQKAQAVPRPPAPATARPPHPAIPQAATNPRARIEPARTPRCSLETPANSPATHAPSAAIANPGQERQTPPCQPHSHGPLPWPAQAPQPPEPAALPTAPLGPAQPQHRDAQIASASSQANTQRHPAKAQDARPGAPLAGPLAHPARSRSSLSAQTAAQLPPAPLPLHSQPQPPQTAPPQAPLPGSRARWYRSLQTTTLQLAEGARCETTQDPASKDVPSQTTSQRAATAPPRAASAADNRAPSTAPS